MYLTSRETSFLQKALLNLEQRAVCAPSVTVYPILTEKI